LQKKNIISVFFPAPVRISVMILAKKRKQSLQGSLSLCLAKKLHYDYRIHDAENCSLSPVKSSPFCHVNRASSSNFLRQNMGKSTNYLRGRQVDEYMDSFLCPAYCSASKFVRPSDPVDGILDNGYFDNFDDKCLNKY
jgi:hypothetical protein